MHVIISSATGPGALIIQVAVTKRCVSRFKILCNCTFVCNSNKNILQIFSDPFCLFKRLLVFVLYVNNEHKFQHRFVYISFFVVHYVTLLVHCFFYRFNPSISLGIQPNKTWILCTAWETQRSSVFHYELCNNRSDDRPFDLWQNQGQMGVRPSIWSIQKNSRHQRNQVGKKTQTENVLI